MRKITKFIVLAITSVLGFNLQKASAIIYFEDGQTYNINYSTGTDVAVLNSADNKSTTINLLAGGRVGTAAIETCDISLFGTSIFNMFDNSDVHHDVIANHYSTVNIYGGHVHHDLITSDNCRVNIYGGAVTGDLHINDNSYVDITGGWLGGNNGHSVFMRDISVTIIEGDNFKIDGQPLDYGVYTKLDIASGRLTGTLLRGQSLNNDFFLYDNASLVLIPEPATLLLIGLGSVVLRKRR